ncbi:MAG: response regulator [Patescibacteria group bacterium]
MRKKLILVIEDEEVILRKIARYLQGLGLEVRTAANLGEARERIENNRFAVIVSDIDLGAESSTDLHAEYVGQLAASHTEWLSMTGRDAYADTEDVKVKYFRGHNIRVVGKGQASFLHELMEAVTVIITAVEKPSGQP